MPFRTDMFLRQFVKNLKFPPRHSKSVFQSSDDQFWNEKVRDWANNAYGSEMPSAKWGGGTPGGAFLEHRNYLRGIFEVPKTPRTFENTSFL